MSKNSSTAVKTVTPHLFANIATKFNTSISVANQGFAPPVATDTISNAQTLWRTKFLTVHTDTEFSPSPTSSAPSSAATENCSTVFFAAVSECIYRQFKGQTPAFICVLHTFGRDLKWNPHVHVLLAEGAADEHGIWRERCYFSYKSLRKSFQTILLKMLLAKLGKPFKKVVAQCYKTAPNGFYINVPKSQGKIRNLIKYIGRYLGRPAIAKSRIDRYDGKNITFHYNRHDDDKLITETLPAEDFIKRLIVHIPEKGFNMVRFYGLYWRLTPNVEKIAKALQTKRQKLLFRELLRGTLGVDPHKCRYCGNTLVFAWLNFTPDNEIRLERSHDPPKRIYPASTS